MTVKLEKYKICLVVSSLSGGGAERSTAILSKLLTSFGCKVTIVTVLSGVEYDYEGNILNLGLIKSENDSFLGRMDRLKIFYNFLRNQDFDFIIDNRARNLWYRELILTKVVYRQQNLIYVVRSFNLKNYFPGGIWFSKLLYAQNCNIVAVSNAIASRVLNLYKFKNIDVINNSLDQAHNHDVSRKYFNFPFILSYGRINNHVKNYSLLIEAYSLSILPQKGIKLVIMGDGVDKDKLIQQVQNNGQNDDIIFIDRDIHPEKYIRQSEFVCLTSRFEGFPRVLIESLSEGTPVISVDCESGPKEIIQHKNNGLLVENHNPVKLAEAMNLLSTDKELYAVLKNNAVSSVEKFSFVEVSKQWEKLLKELE